MPDFEVNEGYVEAGRRRADAPLAESGARSEAPPVPAGEDQLLEEWLSAWYGLTTAEDRVPEAGGEAPAAAEARRLPEETPIVRRTRHRADGHFAGGDAERKRLEVRLIARRRRLARRACPYGRRAHLLGTPLRSRRRLWTTCHGQRPSPPGSP
ncbi:MAG TPA: hypothetical protein VES65_00800 [Solirubrobacteraceae bacterium]|nr:hypothetical protein [Solirubrobacteraceae bacterium]